LRHALFGGIVVVMSNKHRAHNRQRRTAALKARAQRLAGGKMQYSESDALSANEREQFWQHVVDLETAPSTTNFDQLLEAGVQLPNPDTVDDRQLSATLWTVVNALADIHVFISQTDHLSDRELYAHLWHTVLREEVPLLVNGRGYTSHVCLLGGWSDEDTQLFLRYYADEEWRRDWLERYPDLPMPPHEDPPYDPDRQLPKPYERGDP
jgi:hypothetical protein